MKKCKNSIFLAAFFLGAMVWAPHALAAVLWCHDGSGGSGTRNGNAFQVTFNQDEWGSENCDHSERREGGAEGDGIIDGDVHIYGDVSCTDGENTTHIFGFEHCGVIRTVAPVNICVARICAEDIITDCEAALRRLRQQQDEDEEENAARRRDEAAERQRQARIQDMRNSLRPMEEPCAVFAHRFPNYEGAEDLLDGVLRCTYTCENQCASTQIQCGVQGICNPNISQCANLNQANIESCHTACQTELDSRSRDIANCQAQPGEGGIVETGVTGDDLYGDGYVPSGGYEEEGEEVGSGPGGEGGIGNEDIPGAGGEEEEAPAAGEREGGGQGYSQNDYEREVARLTAENLKQVGDNPTPEQRQTAKDQAIADARSEMNGRSVADVREMAGILEQREEFHERELQNPARASREYGERDYRRDGHSWYPTEIPQRKRDNKINTTTADGVSARLIGEGQNGRATGDPVINGTFCYDKVFSRENTPTGPPVEVTGRYCSYQNPDISFNGALGPGWSLNVESHIRYFPGENLLYYQDPNGEMINFMIRGRAEAPPWESGNGEPWSADALDKSCDDNFRYTADFVGVGKPLMIHAEISPDEQDCHQVVFDFVLTHATGEKSYFKQIHDLSKPYPNTTVVETKDLFHEQRPWQTSGDIEPWRFLSTREWLYDRHLAQSIQRTKEIVRERMDPGNRSPIWRENDAGPLGYYLLSQSYQQRTLQDWNRYDDISTITDVTSSGTVIRKTMTDFHDVGYFTDSNEEGRFVSYAPLPTLNIIAPIVRWEDTSGQGTDISRRTRWDKYYAARLSFKHAYDRKKVVGPIEEETTNYNGHPVQGYSFNVSDRAETVRGATYTLYETLVPKETRVTLSNGDTTVTLYFSYRMEIDNKTTATFQRDSGKFDADLVSTFQHANRKDILVLNPRPLLLNTVGDQKTAQLLYGYVSRAGVCNLDLMFDLRGEWHFFGKEGPATVPQTCGTEDSLRLKSVFGGDVTTYGGPLVLMAAIPPNPVTGEADEGEGSAKSEYFFYEPSNPPAGIDSPLYYSRMTETGFLDESPFERIFQEGRFNVAHTPTIINTYNDQNLVETHRLGDTGAIGYTYETIGNEENGQREGKIVHVTSRGNVAESFEYGGEGLLKNHTLHSGGSDLTTTYEYEPPPDRDPHVQGRLKAIHLPDGQRLEYVYRGSGQPNGFYFYQPGIVRRIGTDGNRQQTEFHYVIPHEGLREKITRVVSPAPNSEGGAETVETRFVYDYQAAASEAGLNPCNADKPQGNLVKRIYPDGTYETWKHNTKGQPISYRNPFGVETTYAYFGTGEGCGP